MKAVRILKKTVKIFIISFLSVILLLGILITVALHSENFITRMVLKKVSEIIEAPIKVDNISLLLFKNFPYATVEFEGFLVGTERGLQFDSTNTFPVDTLVRISKLYVSVKTKPLFKNIIEIEKVEIEGFAFNYFVDANGISNIDFLMATDSTAIEEPAAIDSTSSPLNVLLKKLVLRDLTINYNDLKEKASATIYIPEVRIAGKIEDVDYNGNIAGSVLLSNLSFEGTNLHKMKQSAVNFDLKYDNGTIDLFSFLFTTEGISANVEGKVVLADTMQLNLNLGLTDLNLTEALKYAPSEMLAEFGLLHVRGIANIDAQISGNYYDTLLLPSINASLSLQNGRIVTTEYPEIQHLSFSGTLSAPNPNDLKTVSAQFKNLYAATERSHLNIVFSVSNLESPTYNIKSSALINLNEFNKYLPDSTVEYIAGNVGFNLSTKGKLPKNLGLESANYFMSNTSFDVKIRDFSTALDSIDEIKNLSVDFSYKPNKEISISNLSFSAPSYNIELLNTSLSGRLMGSFIDMDNMGIDIESFFAQMGSNIFKGSASVFGFNAPTFKLDSDMKIVLEELRPFMPDSLLAYISGDIDLNISTYGTVDLDSIENYIMPIVFEQSSLKAKVQNLSFQMFDDTLVSATNLSLNFSMANDTIRVDNLYTNLHGIDVWIDSTEIWNVYKAFLLEQRDKKVIVQTQINLSEIDYALFEPLLATDSTLLEEIDTTQTPMYIPQYIVRGTAAVNRIKYDKIILNNVSTKFRIDDSLYVADDLKFDAFGGNMISSLLYNTRNKSQTVVEFKNVANKINIRQLLIDADDFGQTEFTHKNISGILTSSFNGRIVMLDDFSILYDRINVRGNFKLENGGIYNFEPAMELAKSTNLRELDNIVFRTMESSVFIYNNRIYFPKTDIISTAMDISVYGMEGFEDEYEYHLVVHLSDVLLGKSNRLLRKQGMKSDVFEGVDKSKRSGLPLVAMKRDGESKYGIDNKNLQQRMIATIRVQERGLSLIFHPRLINFSTELDRKDRR
jgi:hypothetical protein